MSDGGIEYFQGEAKAEMRSLSKADDMIFSRLKEVEEKVETLRQSSARITGQVAFATIVVSAIVSGVVAWLVASP